MIISMKTDEEKLIEVLSRGGIVVMPTDTLYGIIGLALNVAAVDRIYAIRKRNPKKPFIILIGELSDLNKFSVTLSKEQKRVLKEYWPGPVSIILDCPGEKLAYLHRGTHSLAFRMPLPGKLRNLLRKVGPLVAPSANPEGLLPAQTMIEAKKYFGDSLDLYMDAGTLSGKASKIIKLHEDGTAEVLRE